MIFPSKKQLYFHSDKYPIPQNVSILFFYIILYPSAQSDVVKKLDKIVSK